PILKGDPVTLWGLLGFGPPRGPQARPRRGDRPPVPVDVRLGATPASAATLTIRRARARIGWCFRFSQPLTVPNVTSSSRASCSWVRPRVLRIAFSSAPKSISAPMATSPPLRRTVFGFLYETIYDLSSPRVALEWRLPEVPRGC